MVVTNYRMLEIYLFWLLGLSPLSSNSNKNLRIAVSKVSDLDGIFVESHADVAISL